MLIIETFQLRGLIILLSIKYPKITKQHQVIRIIIQSKIKNNRRIDNLILNIGRRVNKLILKIEETNVYYLSIGG